MPRRAKRQSMQAWIPILCLIGTLLPGLACERDSIEPALTNGPAAPDHGRPAEIERAKTPSELLSGHVADRYPASLETVLEKRFLRVLTSHNAFDFYLYQGRRGGYQYEMVKAFTRFLNKKHTRGRGDLPIQFELIPVHSDQLIPLLLEGAADLVAARLTVTPERTGLVRFLRHRLDTA